MPGIGRLEDAGGLATYHGKYGSCWYYRRAVLVGPFLYGAIHPLGRSSGGSVKSIKGRLAP